MNTLTALKRSSLGLDLYHWLVYRTFPVRAPQRLTWQQVYRQFGAHPDKASDRVTVRYRERPHERVWDISNRRFGRREDLQIDATPRQIALAPDHSFVAGVAGAFLEQWCFGCPKHRHDDT